MTLRLHDPAGALIAGLPLARSVSVLAEHNAPGVLTFDYPRGGPGAAELLAADAGYLAAAEDGADRAELFLLDTDSDNTPADSPSGLVTTTHPGYLRCLEWAAIYPGRHTPGGKLAGLDPRAGFRHGTAGFIALTLISRARARGALPFLDCDFTAAADSAGLAWPVTYSIIYEGGSVLDAIMRMCEDGWADVRTAGRTLRMFVPDTTCGTDRPGVVLRGGATAPVQRKRARGDARTHLLTLGRDQAAAETGDPAAELRLGERREAFEGRSDVADQATLARVNATGLAAVTAPPETLTCAYGPGPGVPGYPADYQAGDFVRHDSRRAGPGAYEKLRVASVTTTYGGVLPSWSVELNDPATEARLRAAKRINRIVAGSLRPGPPALTPAAPPPSGDEVTDSVDPRAGDLRLKDGGAQVWDGAGWEPAGSGGGSGPAGSRTLTVMMHSIGFDWKPDSPAGPWSYSSFYNYYYYYVAGRYIDATGFTEVALHATVRESAEDGDSSVDSDEYVPGWSAQLRFNTALLPDGTGPVTSPAFDGAWIPAGGSFELTPSGGGREVDTGWYPLPPAAATLALWRLAAANPPASSLDLSVFVHPFVMLR